MRRWFLIALIGLTGQAWADDCSRQYPGGAAPVIQHQGIAAEARALCFEAYALMYAPRNRLALWSAENLTASKVSAAYQVDRDDAFHEEKKLPVEHRADLSWYSGSAYDRGHLVPAANMPTEKSQYESFSLANMVPQEPAHNRGLWADIESATRGLARQRGGVYVITGPLHLNAVTPSTARGRELARKIPIPSHLFKLIYDMRTGEAGVYLSPNDNSRRYSVISVSQLEALSGIDFLPVARKSIKERAMILPEPRGRDGAVTPPAPLTGLERYSNTDLAKEVGRRTMKSLDGPAVERAAREAVKNFVDMTKGFR